MTTPAYTELLTAIRREGSAIVSCGEQDLDVAVETCGDWKMHQLLLHVASVYHRAATAVSDRATAAVEWQPFADDTPAPVSVLTDALDELVQALSEAEPETPVWNWSGDNQTAAFWARRMTHESSVHRFDAQRANGVAEPLDADLAEDGFDELVDLLVPRIIQRDAPVLTPATYRFAATDDGEWLIELTDDGIARPSVLKDPDITVAGTASALLLAAYGRIPWTSLEVTGDTSALDAWSKEFRF
jgi:uncharacterized protein (TIGR03083 family)